MGRLVAVICLAVLSAAAGAAEDACVIATAVRQPYTAPDRGGFLDRLIGEMFRRIGRKGEMRVYESPERPLINADQGVDDGTALRIRGLELQYPNLVRVPEKLLDNEFVAYSLRHKFATPDWQSLAPYHVAYLLGWKVFENNLPATQPATTVKDPTQLFELLQRERVDVALYERWQGLWWARQLKLPMRVMEPALAKTEMFLYLNKRHAALAGQLASELAAMKRDGSYRRIFDETLTTLAHPH